MLSAKLSRIVAGAVAGMAVVGAVRYRRQVSAMPNKPKPGSWKEKAQKEAYRPAYNNPPPGYKHELFEPSFNFPTTLPGEDYKELPWMQVDFKTEPECYLKTVLDYCFEGNTECDFRVQNNKVRTWYNAPWMATRPFGREPIHGLTMERPADPGYIAKEDKRWVQTWAVGFYNDFGAYTIGKFWENPGKPTLTDNVKFPPGTVAFKLLFTQATEDDIPSLEGSKVWEAAIGIPKPPIPPSAPRREVDKRLEKAMTDLTRGPPVQLRLIQVDVMIRDPRSEEIGWVFGTFMYNKDQPEDDPWKRLVPMCLQWGNDPNLTPEAYHDHGHRPVQTWTNPSVKGLKLLPKGRPYLGWLERANGIVDNFISCCASCHSTASFLAQKPPESPSTPDMVPDTMKWFRNIKAGEPFEDGVLSLDYSLQLNSGLMGYNQWLKSNPQPKSSKFFK